VGVRRREKKNNKREKGERREKEGERAKAMWFHPVLLLSSYIFLGLTIIQ